MSMTLRRSRRIQFVQLLTAGLVLCVVTVCWEELDYHVVSHVRSYSYRYLVNNYDFLNSTFSINSKHHRGDDSAGSVDFPYLINHPRKCRGSGDDGRQEDVLLLLFVKSSPENFEQRQAIRDTWGNQTFIWTELRANVKLVFALGTHRDVRRRSQVQAALLQEDRACGDLVQQDFEDTFHNLTLKMILQFHWGQEYCPQAHFLMSADDDIFVHTPNLVKYLRQLMSSQSEARNLWVGHVHRGSPPIRRKDSKYYVPYELYPWPSYPDYTSGAAYVVSGDVATKIYQATLLLNASLYIDDVFMGVCAKTMGVSPQHNGHFSGEGKTPYQPCVYDHMITSHGHITDLRSLWQMATEARVRGTNRGCTGWMK